MPSRAATFRLPSQMVRKPEARPSSYARGYGGAAWKALRDSIYVRDQGMCQHCGRVVAGREAHVDHIVSKRQGGADTPSNLQLLCRPCHSVKTRQEASTGG